MRKLLIKILFFCFLLTVLFKVNIEVFRGDQPFLIIVSLGVSIIVLVYFPYIKFFKNNKNKTQS